MSNNPTPFEAWGKELPPLGTTCSVDFSRCVSASALTIQLFGFFRDRNVVITHHDHISGFDVAVFRAPEVGVNHLYFALREDCFKPAMGDRDRDIEALTAHFEDQLCPNGEASDRLAHYRCVAALAHDFIAARSGKSGGAR